MRVLIVVVAFVVCMLSYSCKKESAQPDPVPPDDSTKVDTSKADSSKLPGYKLEWSDEFDYSGLPDPSRWDYEIGYVRNNEAQYYVEGQIENSRVANGMLYINATLYNSRPNPITSASIITKVKKHFLYGRLEARLKMPKGKGTWPAFWTMGTNRDVVGWPACGEIDIMEWLGFEPQYVFGSLHKANDQNIDKPFIGPYFAPVDDLSDKFHVYALEWDSTSVSFYFDTVRYAHWTAQDMPASEWAQFTKPHYLLLNLALGGDSGGAIDSTRFPFTYTVDYVRYYSKEK